MKTKERTKNTGPDILDDLGEFIEKKFAYLKAFLDDKGVAAVTPSSKFLVERVIKAMDVRRSELVVEYGAAEGVITRSVLGKMPPRARLVAVEFNEKLYRNLKGISDARLRPVLGDVRQIESILEGVSVGSVDSIVSGIPFAFLRPRQRHELLTKTADYLKPGGRFVAYQVTTHLIPLLKDYFSRVKTDFEIRNLPPHFIFTCFK